MVVESFKDLKELLKLPLTFELAKSFVTILESFVVVLLRFLDVNLVHFA